MDISFYLKSVVIVAGGSGKRMNSDIPKQFLKIGNLPVLMHTINKFFNFNNDIEIVLVLPENQIEYWLNLCEIYSFDIKHKIAKGGTERFFSVKNGLQKIDKKDGLVAIHDGVRPFVSSETLIRGINSALKSKAAIPVVPITSSVRIVHEDESKHFDRNIIREVQTPQIFDFKLINEAYSVEFNSSFTDDASVVETCGQFVSLFDGNLENIKITTKFDLDFANFLLKNNKV